VRRQFEEADSYDAAFDDFEVFVIDDEMKPAGSLADIDLEDAGLVYGQRVVDSEVGVVDLDQVADARKICAENDVIGANFGFFQPDCSLCEELRLILARLLFSRVGHEPNDFTTFPRTSASRRNAPRLGSNRHEAR